MGSPVKLDAAIMAVLVGDAPNLGVSLLPVVASPLSWRARKGERKYVDPFGASSCFELPPGTPWNRAKHGGTIREVAFAVISWAAWVELLALRVGTTPAPTGRSLADAAGKS